MGSGSRKSIQNLWLDRSGSKRGLDLGACDQDHAASFWQAPVSLWRDPVSFWRDPVSFWQAPVSFWQAPFIKKGLLPGLVKTL